MDLRSLFKIFHWYGDLTISGEGLQNTPESWLSAEEQGGFFCAIPAAVTRELVFLSVFL
jgi:hypothetical protein